jgi:hypothetical protein
MDNNRIDKTKIMERIAELQRNLNKSYSQSDPGAMMDRRFWKKELNKLNEELEKNFKTS